MSKQPTSAAPVLHSYELLQLSLNRVPRWQMFSLRTLIAEVCGSLAPQLASHAIRTEIDVPPKQFISADREMLGRAVLHLMLNALDAMPRGGELVITSVSTPWAAELEVADSGEGLSDEVRRRAFEPLFTTKEKRPGLGLTVAAQIAETHGGYITAVNCPEGGAAFTLRIPQVIARRAAA